MSRFQFLDQNVIENNFKFQTILSIIFPSAYLRSSKKEEEEKHSKDDAA